MNQRVPNPLSRRQFLTTSAAVTGSGLISQTVTGRSTNSTGSQKDGWSSGFSDAITIEGGRAKSATVSAQRARTVSVERSRGHLTGAGKYSAQDFAEDINKGVRIGIWKVAKKNGRIVLHLTEKGERLVQKTQAKVRRGRTRDGAQSHQDVDSSVDSQVMAQQQDCNGVTKKEGDTVYFDDFVTDQIQIAFLTTGTYMTIVGIIIGAIGAFTLGPGGAIPGAVVAITGALMLAGSSAIGIMNEGCGIKVVNTTDVRTQECPLSC